MTAPDAYPADALRPDPGTARPEGMSSGRGRSTDEAAVPAAPPESGEAAVESRTDDSDGAGVSPTTGAGSGGPPPAPPEAVDVFGPRLRIAERYVARLADAGIRRGLLGPREVPRLWDRHLLNCAVLVPELEEGADVADVGSGAGLPGVVLAICRPDLQVTLIEPLLRRTTFLHELVSDLDLGNVDVLRARAEDVRGRDFDVVTARAVAPLEKLWTWSAPLLRPSGHLLALKGSSSPEELRAAQPVLRRRGAASASVRQLGAGDTATWLVDIVASATAGRRAARGRTDRHAESVGPARARRRGTPA